MKMRYVRSMGIVHHFERVGHFRDWLKRNPGSVQMNVAALVEYTRTKREEYTHKAGCTCLKSN